MDKLTEGLRLSNVPFKYWPQVAKNISMFLSKEGAMRAVDMDLSLKAAFPWSLTEEGHDFWQAIFDGEDPEDAQREAAIHAFVDKLRDRLSEMN
jgi:hypothetical protein